MGLLGALFGGGDSSSDNSQTTTTESNDNSVVGGNGSTNVSISKNSGSINLALTDHGAVEKSFELARQVTRDAINSATDSLQTVQEVERDAMSRVSDAFATAKAGEQKLFAGAILGLIAIVAVKVLGK